MATGDRICPYCGRYQCICEKVLRKMIRDIFPKMNFPPEEPETHGTKGKAIKPKWQVQLFPSLEVGEFVTVYAYNINICEGGQSIVADGVKIEFGEDVSIIGLDEIK